MIPYTLDLSENFDNGYNAARRTVAATLTRLRATIKDDTTDDSKGYLRALEHVASAHNLKAQIVTTVKYTAE